MSTRQNFAENWINHNRDVVGNYRAEWIAYNLDGIIAHGKELSEVTKHADKSKKEYILYLVPAYFGEVRFI